jgi:ribosomal protein S2
MVFVCDPKGERGAIMESAKNGVPVIALCDTDNETKYIDLVVPINNKGRRSLALVFYILSREIMLAQGSIKTYDEFKYDINFFERLEMEEKESPKATVVKEEEVAVPPAPAEEKKPEEKKAAKKPKEEKAAPKVEEKPEKKEAKPAEAKKEKPAEEKAEKKKAAPKKKEEPKKE